MLLFVFCLVVCLVDWLKETTIRHPKTFSSYVSSGTRLLLVWAVAELTFRQLCSQR